MKNYGFGVDLGGTTVKLGFFRKDGTLLHKWEIPTDTRDSGKHILPDIAGALRCFLQEKGIAKAEVLGIGIGVPGPVDSQGVVNKCINLGWEKFSVRQALQELTDLPVAAGNDANLAALGESWRGGGQGCKNMVLATLGTGVGGGIILDGKPLFGVHGAAGEIGHLVVNPRETQQCSCGKFGCAEQYCSATGIVRLAKEYLNETHCPSALRALPEITCKAVFDAAGGSDAAAMEILEQVYDYMGQFLANVCCAVDPETVVLGGGVSKAGPALLAGVKKYFDRYIFHASNTITFALAALGNDAGAYGACKLLLDSLSSDNR